MHTKNDKTLQKKMMQRANSEKTLGGGNKNFGN
jgi:hypothetical protein